jgi:hypothetical protein
MTKCYETLGLEMMEQIVRDGVPDPWTTSDWVMLPDEAMIEMDAILAHFGATAAEWCERLNFSFSKEIVMPWAIMALSREYRLAGHLCRIRGTPSEMRLSCYSKLPADRPSTFVPPLGCIFIANKAVLQAAAARSPLLESAWSALAEKASNVHWLCIPEPPSDDWVRVHEAGDDALFQTITQRR